MRIHLPAPCPRLRYARRRASVVGSVVDAMLAPQEATHASTMRPLPAPTGTEGAQRLAEAWRRIVFTPMRISALNTLSAGISLTAVLPLPVIHLPLTKTMMSAPESKRRPQADINLVRGGRI